MGDVELAAPGAGVPWWQRMGGKYFFLPLYTRRLAWEEAIDLLCREGAALLRRGGGIDAAALEQRVLVPPQVGLEDSSRRWSYAMVLEHLWIIGRRAADVIVTLSHGRAPSTPLDTADLKPAGDLSATAAREEFERFLGLYRGRLTDDVGDPRSPTRFEHPWFGPLTARQWVCFMPFHQRIHMRQVKRILAGLPDRQI